MAKRILIRGLETIGLSAGVAAATAIALVEVVNAALGVLLNRPALDGGLMMPHLDGLALGFLHFFVQLQTEFEVLARLVSYAVPAPDLSLIFAAVSALAAYVLIENRKEFKPEYKAGRPIAILAVVVAGLPIAVSILATTIF